MFQLVKHATGIQFVSWHISFMYQCLCTEFLKHFVDEKISPKLNFILEVFELTKSIQNQKPRVGRGYNNKTYSSSSSSSSGIKGLELVCNINEKCHLETTIEAV